MLGTLEDGTRTIKHCHMGRNCILTSIMPQCGILIFSKDLEIIVAFFSQLRIQRLFSTLVLGVGLPLWDYLCLLFSKMCLIRLETIDRKKERL